MGKRQVISKNNNIYISGEEDFEPKHIFENGQAFRWEENGGDYTLVADKYVIRVKKLAEAIVLENAGSMKDYEDFWRKYFDMDRDYPGLRRELSQIDNKLKMATEAAVGLRVLKQDLFEMIISFIISANNNISRIKKSIEKLSELCGEKICEIDSKAYYKFPSVSAIADLNPDYLAEYTGVGYRAPYLVKTGKMIENAEVDLGLIDKLDYEAAHKELMRLAGVGPKVADCILLFGNSRDMAFPVDTWVIKVMNEYYLGNEKNSKRIKAEGHRRFGDKAGLAQQYLFYHARENKLGTKK